jgi:hypothetical protein
LVFKKKAILKRIALKNGEMGNWGIGEILKSKRKNIGIYIKYSVKL